MYLGKRFLFLEHPFLGRIATFSLIIFFVLLADGILSYWVPNFLQASLGGSSLAMGIVFGFSSLVGLIADLLFPQLLKNFTVRALLLSAIITGSIFILSLGLGLKYPFILIFLFSMASWGIYYEFLGFATHQFIADQIPAREHASGWGILSVFRNLAYFLGPLLGAWLVLRNESYVINVSAMFVTIGFLVLLITNKHHERKLTINPGEVNLWKEIAHWKELSMRVWPILTISFFIGLIDASFWTVGAVWTESLSKQSVWGGFLLPAYQLPSIFVGILIARLMIYKGKKKRALKYLLLSGVSLCFLAFNLPILVYVLIVLVSSFTLSLCYPLVDAVYSDIIARMGIQRKHLVGLSNSTFSLSYIVGPVIAGYLAELSGIKNTFVIFGAFSIIVSLFLLKFAPKKLRLPKNKISKWRT